MKANRFVGVVESFKKRIKSTNPTENLHYFFLSAWNKQLFAVITDVLLF
jgi:hypothetical protein